MVSDAVQMSVIGAIATIVPAGMTAVVAVLIARLNTSMNKRQDEVADRQTRAARKTDEVANKVEEVRRTTEHTANEAAGKLDTIHGLVNSAMGTQLRLYMLATKRLAENGDPADVEVARLAQEAWEQHEVQQAKMDAKGQRHDTKP